MKNSPEECAAKYGRGLMVGEGVTQLGHITEAQPPKEGKSQIVTHSTGRKIYGLSRKKMELDGQNCSYIDVLTLFWCSNEEVHNTWTHLSGGEIKASSNFYSHLQSNFPLQK